MHKPNQLLAKCASGILSFSLIMSMIPSVPAWAEEDFSDEYVSEEILDGTEAVAEEDFSSIFYITKFTDFEKDAEGHFTNEETKEKYGDLKAETGTPLEDLNLPENLNVEGYWASDGSDVISSMTLENIIWKLKSDTGEEYTEASPEGTYTFIPDYEAYVMEYDDLDDILLADGVADLTIDVQIIAASAETESETESETAVPDTNIDNTDTTDQSDTSAPETDADIIDLDQSESDTSNTDDTSDDTDPADTSVDEDVNIFDNLDDSAIDASSQEDYKGSYEEPASEEVTLTGTLVFRNAGDDTVIYQYPSDGSSTIHFTAGEVTSLPSIQLPCNAALNSLSVKFVLSDSTAYDLTQADFTDGSTKRITFTDGSNTYSLDLALTKADHVSAHNETCTKNATCSVCGAELEGTALGHDWAPATCTTPKTCKRCHATEGTALGHDWAPATCTTPKTCKRCHATEGTALGHDLRDDWETVEESTYTSHGYQERYCHRDNCDYSESRDLNIIGDPTDDAIQNLTEGAVYDVNSRITFSAYGAASENTSPIDNDVRYIPSTWSIQGTTGTWLDNYSGAFSISKAGTYTVTVTFQKQVYGDGSWQNTDIVDSKSVTFSIGGASTDGSNDAVRINPRTGDQTQILPFVIILAAAAIVIIVVLVLRRKKKQ